MLAVFIVAGRTVVGDERPGPDDAPKVEGWYPLGGCVVARCDAGSSPQQIADAVERAVTQSSWTAAFTAKPMAVLVVGFEEAFRATFLEWYGLLVTYCGWPPVDQVAVVHPHGTAAENLLSVRIPLTAPFAFDTLLHLRQVAAKAATEVPKVVYVDDELVCLAPWLAVPTYRSGAAFDDGTFLRVGVVFHAHAGVTNPQKFLAPAIAALAHADDIFLIDHKLVDYPVGTKVVEKLVNGQAPLRGRGFAHLFTSTGTSTAAVPQHILSNPNFVPALAVKPTGADGVKAFLDATWPRLLLHRSRREPQLRPEDLIPLLNTYGFSPRSFEAARRRAGELLTHAPGESTQRFLRLLSGAPSGQDVAGWFAREPVSVNLGCRYPLRAQGPALARLISPPFWDDEAPLWALDGVWLVAKHLGCQWDVCALVRRLLAEGGAKLLDHELGQFAEATDPLPHLLNAADGAWTDDKGKVRWQWSRTGERTGAETNPPLREIRQKAGAVVGMLSGPVGTPRHHAHRTLVRYAEWLAIKPTQALVMVQLLLGLTRKHANHRHPEVDDHGRLEIGFEATIAAGGAYADLWGEVTSEGQSIPAFPELSEWWIKGGAWSHKSRRPNDLIRLWILAHVLND